MDKKYLIIAGLLIIIILLIIGIVFISMGNVTAYKNFTCNDTGTTFEVPVDLKVRQDQNNFGIRLTVMSTPDGDIVIERSLSNNPYMAEGMSGASDLLNSYDGDKVNGVEIHTCSRTVKNDATGEVIMVSSNRGDNETVEHIINSIKWGNRTVANNNTADATLDNVSSSITPTSSNEVKNTNAEIQDLDSGDDLYYDDDLDVYYDSDGSIVSSSESTGASSSSDSSSDSGTTSSSAVDVETTMD